MRSINLTQDCTGPKLTSSYFFSWQHVQGFLNISKFQRANQQNKTITVNPSGPCYWSRIISLESPACSCLVCYILVSVILCMFVLCGESGKIKYGKWNNNYADRFRIMLRCSLYPGTCHIASAIQLLAKPKRAFPPFNKSVNLVQTSLCFSLFWSDSNTRGEFIFS